MKNIREIDALYKTVPLFDDWASCSVDSARWARYTDQLSEFKSRPELFERSRQIVKRATAIDTGAIEGLYEVDRGFTITVALETSTWEARIAEKGGYVRALIESQLRAYDYVLDFATQAVPIAAEAWIRRLHQEICAGQETYRVMTEAGWQNQSLPVGEYKHHSNHVEKMDGKIHPYAPVDQTPSEMRRFVEQIRSDAFQAAHPVLQAAYAHYGLVWIHPFADGNGRTARALASAFTYRAASIPLMILADRKPEYLDSLSAADDGNRQAFVDFVLDRMIEATELIAESFKTAGTDSIDPMMTRLSDLYSTKGAFTQAEVDAAGSRLLEVFNRELSEIVRKHSSNHLKLATGGGGSQFKPARGLRGLQPNETPIISFKLETVHPARAGFQTDFILLLPINCGKEDALIIQPQQATMDRFEVRITDLVPDISGSAQLRLRMYAERAFAHNLQGVIVRAEKVLGEGRKEL
jgi:Fic family protein